MERPNLTRFMDAVREDMAVVEVTEQDEEDWTKLRWKIPRGKPKEEVGTLYIVDTDHSDGRRLDHLDWRHSRVVSHVGHHVDGRHKDQREPYRFRQVSENIQCSFLPGEISTIQPNLRNCNAMIFKFKITVFSVLDNLVLAVSNFSYIVARNR